ncbi:MAG: DUF4358 domain-containing protein [Eubacteriales bacterium]
MRKILVLILASTLLLSCCTRNRAPVYRNDLTAAEIADRIAGDLPDFDNLSDYSDEDIAFYLGIPADLASDQSVRVQTNSVSIDEFGVFKAENDSQAEELENLLQNYLDSSLEGKREWLESYNPTEMDKLEEAEIKRYGSYVVYLILDRADRRVAKENVTKILTE